MYGERGEEGDEGVGVVFLVKGKLVCCELSFKLFILSSQGRMVARPPRIAIPVHPFPRLSIITTPHPYPYSLSIKRGHIPDSSTPAYTHPNSSLPSSYPAPTSAPTPHSSASSRVAPFPASAMLSVSAILTRGM